MYRESVERWQHAHVFGQDEKKARRKSHSVCYCLDECYDGTGDCRWAGRLCLMALLADGLHMASHAAALVSAFAYVYARRRHTDGMLLV